MTPLSSTSASKPYNSDGFLVREYFEVHSDTRKLPKHQHSIPPCSSNFRQIVDYAVRLVCTSGQSIFARARSCGNIEFILKRSEFWTQVHCLAKFIFVCASACACASLLDMGLSFSGLCVCVRLRLCHCLCMVARHGSDDQQSLLLSLPLCLSLSLSVSEKQNEIEGNLQKLSICASSRQLLQALAVAILLCIVKQSVSSNDFPVTGYEYSSEYTSERIVQ